MSQKVTIQDIADALDMSRNTVSKAINNSDGIADATRDRVLQKAMEMGYKQFSYVSALAGISTEIVEKNRRNVTFQGEIALLTGRFLNHSHFATLMLDKLEQELSQMGYTMSTHRVSEKDIEDKVLPATLNMKQVKGFLCVEMFDWDYDMMLCGLDIPLLFVDGPAKIGGRSLPADQLYMENANAIAQFTNKMLSNGKTKIGFVGDFHHCQSFYERYYAFYMTMTMAGYPVRPEHIVRYNEPEELFDYFHTHSDIPEVYVCANDFVAWDAMRALSAVGKQAPKDVLICGFDDSAESRFSKPPLTTVHIYTQGLAFSAVHLLTSRINEPSLEYRTLYTDSELIYRESSKIE